MKDSYHLLRHATAVLTFNNLKFLIDPMLSEKEAMDPVQNAGNNRRIPVIDLPIDKVELSTILKEIDAVIITHTHQDHWDATAQNLIEKSKLIFCQPSDMQKIKEIGFQHVVAIESLFTWNGIAINRTSGKHGTGEIGEKMGDVSGFVLSYDDKSIYIAGDTIWCEEVESALTTFNPLTTILNAGGARFVTGGPITMIPQDIIKVNTELPKTKIIAVHMDVVNHCLVTRTDLLKVLTDYNLQSTILIPKDNQIILL
jgi:L-ascorbate metabolism protein UlaG (beta-lactamase superfamily)